MSTIASEKQRCLRQRLWRLPVSWILLSLLLSVPTLQGQFAYIITNGTVTITRYTGPGGAVVIPSMTNGLPVTSIGVVAFLHCTTVTSVTIADSVTSIGMSAFGSCSSLTNVIIGNGVTTIADAAFNSCGSLRSVIIPSTVTSMGAFVFDSCTSLANVTIAGGVPSIGEYSFNLCSNLTNATFGNGLASIGDFAFYGCGNLISLTFPSKVLFIGDGAFYGCYRMKAIYCEGDAPNLGGANAFYLVPATIYYLPGTAGWTSTFGGRPTALWLLPNPVILTGAPSFGIRSNHFGFTISWATNVPVVVEASTDLGDSRWLSITTNTLPGGWSYFSDADWSNYPTRYYRLSSP